MKIKSNIALSESGFIFNPNTGESFTLNPIGQELFGMLREDKNMDEIRDEFLEKYDIEESILEKDFDDFIHLLTNYQIIEEDEQA